MKKFSWLAWLILSFVVAPVLLAVAPDFSANYRFTNRAGEPTDGIIVYNGATRSLPIANYSLGCVGWELDYNSEGLSGVSVNLQTNTKSWLGGLNFGPGNSWTTFSGTNSSGSLPMTSTSQGTYIGYAYFPYIAVNVATFTGTGSVDVVLKCWKSINYASTGGGAGTSITGDVTGTLAASVVAKVNGITANSSGTNLIFPCYSASGSATAFTCTTGSSLTLTDGMMFLWRPDVNCGTNPTLAVDGGTARGIYYQIGNGQTLNVGAPFCQATSAGGGGFIPLLLQYQTTTLPLFVAVNTANAILDPSCQIAGAVWYNFNATNDLVFCNIVPTFLSNRFSSGGYQGYRTGNPTLSGCSATIGTGSTNFAGFVTSGTTGTCTITLTFVNPTVTYTTGVSCMFSNETTVANLFNETTSATGSVVATGTTVSGDVVRYICGGY